MKFAETFPPGEFLKEELEARNWSQIEFAEIIGRPVKMVNEIIQGKRAISPETAVQIGAALGTGAELWMNLESQYRLSQVQAPDKSIAKKARLYERFPVREMVKRGWIDATDSIDALESQLVTFFRLSSMDEQVRFPHSAKMTTEHVTSLQHAWLFTAHNLANRIVLPRYQPDALSSALPRLNALLSAPEEVRHVPRLLSECGVRFVVVEPLPSSMIDGACFWLDGEQPAIAMSTRLDRIDNFWFVLRHEIEHVLQGHGKQEAFIVDEDVLGTPPESKSEEERIADNAASDFGVSRAELESYIARVRPYFFAETKILNFSSRLGIHPGIVLGRLQYRFREDPKVWRYLRQHLVKVRNNLIQSAPHDGWGTSAFAA